MFNINQISKEKLLAKIDQLKNELGEEKFKRALELVQKIEDKNLTVSFACPKCGKTVTESIFTFMQLGENQDYACPLCHEHYKMSEIKELENFISSFPSMLLEVGEEVEKEASSKKVDS